MAFLGEINESSAYVNPNRIACEMLHITSLEGLEPRNVACGYFPRVRAHCKADNSPKSI